jgi:transposase
MATILGPFARKGGLSSSRVPSSSHTRDRVIFEKLIEVLVFGCAYHRIADESCSATALRDRRDEWIEAGVIEELRDVVLEAYDRYIGLELSEVAVDCCITKELHVEGRRRAGARWTGANKA